MRNTMQRASRPQAILPFALITDLRNRAQLILHFLYCFFFRFLRYLMQTLDAYVDMDYCLVYFHHGLTSKNKPPLRWLWDAYKLLDRRYKKNLKTLFLVHPTNFIRVVWNFFKPMIR